MLVIKQILGHHVWGAIWTLQYLLQAEWMKNMKLCDYPLACPPAWHTPAKAGDIPLCHLLRCGWCAGLQLIKKSSQSSFSDRQCWFNKVGRFHKGYLYISKPLSQKVIKMFGFKRSVHSMFDIIYRIEIEIVKQKQIFLSFMKNLFWIFFYEILLFPLYFPISEYSVFVQA